MMPARIFVTNEYRRVKRTSCLELSFSMLAGGKQPSIESAHPKIDERSKVTLKSLVQYLVVLRTSHSFLVQAQVQGIILEQPVVGPDVHYYWQDSAWAEACCCDIQVQLPCAGQVPAVRGFGCREWLDATSDAPSSPMFSNTPGC